jgi:hypothetical protein
MSFRFINYSIVSRYAKFISGIQCRFWFTAIRYLFFPDLLAGLYFFICGIRLDIFYYVFKFFEIIPQSVLSGLLMIDRGLHMLSNPVLFLGELESRSENVV